MKKSSCCMCDVILRTGNTAHNHGISNYDLEFCSSCVNDEDYDAFDGNKLKTIIPKELMTLISYYLEDPRDIISAAKSNVFPPMGIKDYWINRIHYEFPNIPCYVIREPLIRYDYFYRSINFYYEVKVGSVDLLKDYARDFQNNELFCKSENKIKVLYHYYGKDHDGYCSDYNEEMDVNEYQEFIYNLPENTSIFPRDILNKSRDHYMNCGETYYRILSVTYIKDNVKKLKNKAHDKENLIKKFGASETKLKVNYPIHISCELCGTKSVNNSNIIKCKGCHN